MSLNEIATLAYIFIVTVGSVLLWTLCDLVWQVLIINPICGFDICWDCNLKLCGKGGFFYYPIILSAVLLMVVCLYYGFLGRFQKKSLHSRALRPLSPVPHKLEVLLDELCCEMKLHRNSIECVVHLHDKSALPSVVGTESEPRVLLPLAFFKVLETDPDACRAMLAHELGHIIQRDIKLLYRHRVAQRVVFRVIVPVVILLSVSFFVVGFGQLKPIKEFNRLYADNTGIIPHHTAESPKGTSTDEHQMGEIQRNVDDASRIVRTAGQHYVESVMIYAGMFAPTLLFLPFFLLLVLSMARSRSEKTADLTALIIAGRHSLQVALRADHARPSLRPKMLDWSPTARARAIERVCTLFPELATQNVHSAARPDPALQTLGFWLYTYCLIFLIAAPFGVIFGQDLTVVENGDWRDFPALSEAFSSTIAAAVGFSSAVLILMRDRRAPTLAIIAQALQILSLSLSITFPVVWLPRWQYEDQQEYQQALISSGRDGDWATVGISSLWILYFLRSKKVHAIFRADGQQASSQS